MFKIDGDDLLFKVKYSRKESSYGSLDVKKGDTFDGIDDLKYELESWAESINGYYEIIADGRNGNLIAIEMYGGFDENGDYIYDSYLEIECTLRESAIPSIGKFLEN